MVPEQQPKYKVGARFSEMLYGRMPVLTVLKNVRLVDKTFKYVLDSTTEDGQKIVTEPGSRETPREVYEGLIDSELKSGNWKKLDDRVETEA
jgi:hypothetical protein